MDFVPRLAGSSLALVQWWMRRLAPPAGFDARAFIYIPCLVSTGPLSALREEEIVVID